MTKIHPQKIKKLNVNINDLVSWNIHKGLNPLKGLI